MASHGLMYRQERPHPCCCARRCCRRLQGPIWMAFCRQRTLMTQQCVNVSGLGGLAACTASGRHAFEKERRGTERSSFPRLTPAACSSKI